MLLNSRLSLVFCLLILSVISTTTRSQAEQVENGDAVFTLGTPDAYVQRKARRTRGHPAHLYRELIRQSLLLAAREELGLITRDATLGDVIIDEEQGCAPPISIKVVVPGRAPGRLTIFDSQTNQPLGDVNFGGKRIPPATRALVLATRGEQLSRAELVGLLENAGYARRIDRGNAATRVPPEVEDQLLNMNEFSQFAAVRRLHEIGSAEGHSAKLLGALARGYANLAQLTRHLPNPSNAAFQARAMLYAERLVVDKAETADAYWCRGFVRGLGGFHAAALDDLERARELAEAESSPPMTPPWSTVWCLTLGVCRLNTPRRAQIASPLACSGRKSKPRGMIVS